MKTELLQVERLRDFIDFCRKHRKEIDDSYIYDEDLEEFLPGGEYPAYIVTNEKQEPIAAASLILNGYWKGLKKARIRIFYSKIADAAIYRLLLDALLPHTEGFDGIYGFVPLEDKKTLEIFKELDFITERYSFLFVNDDIRFRENKLPSGYAIRPLEPGRDEQAWCDVRNTAFRTLKGNEAPITAGMLKLTMEARDHIEGGLMLLCHRDRPVGVIRGADDEYNGMRVLNIGAAAVIPEYQGQGLGKCLLRAALNFAHERSYTKATLSVNADNETAKSLYLKEGFRQAEGFAGLRYDLKTTHLS